MALQKYGPSTCHLYTMLPPSAILIILSKKCKVITHFWFIFSLDENLKSSASVKMIDFAHVWPAEVFLIIIIMPMETFSYFHCKKQIKNGDWRAFKAAVFWILSSVLRRTAARQFRIIFLICLHFHGIWSTLPMNISIKNTEQYLYGVSELLFCYLKVILIERGRKTEKTGLVWQIDTWDISWK